MGVVDGAQILVKALKQEGIEKIFTLSGGHIYRVHQEAQKLGIKIVDFRHEGAAGFAAETYALATGKPAVLLVTAGPGVTNVMTQVCDAKLGNVPLLVIGGASPVGLELTDMSQDYDCMSLMKPNTVWSYRVADTHRIAESVAVAFRNLMGDVPGPVYLELPADVLQYNKVNEDTVRYPLNYRTAGRMFGDPALIEKCAELLISAQRPVMVIGDGTQYNCQNPGAFKELAEYLQIPVCTLDTYSTNAGRYFINDEPLSQIGMLGVGQADVLLTFNCSLGYGRIQGYPPDAKLINVHRNSNKIGLNIPLEVGIIGYSDAVAEQILDCVKKKTAKQTESGWVKSLIQTRAFAIKAMDEGFESDSIPMRPSRIAGEIQKFLAMPEGKKFNYVVDGGDSMAWCATAAAFKLSNNRLHRLFFMSFLGSIGYSWGAVTGLWEADGIPILHSTGDGSFSHYANELFTIAKNKIPYVCVILNDGYWGMIKAHAMHDDPEADTCIGNKLAPAEGGFFRYEKIAEAWGGYNKFITDPKDLLPALIEAAAAAAGGIPAIVNCAMGFDNEYISQVVKNAQALMSAPLNIRY